MTTRKRADALLLAFALAMILVLVGYRYGWQSFRHTIPPDKLAIDIRNTASTAATLDLVLEQFAKGHLPAGYVRAIGENAHEDLREEWSHTLERDAARDSVLEAYRATLAELDTLTSGMAAPSFTVARAESSRSRLSRIESTLGALP